MTQAVRDLLARMQAQLPPPSHLRADAKAREQFLADYEQVLAGWSKDVLDDAWPIVLSRLEYWIWPRPQQIHDACKQVAAQRRQPSDLDQRREQALDMADRYVRHYLHHSQLARMAKLEGWIEPLRSFARESAWVQAQLLCKVHPVAWDASIAAHLGTFRDAADAFDAFRSTITGTLQRGRIEVRVPPVLIRQWKGEHGQDKPRTCQLA